MGDQDGVDWTISEAPAPDEVPAADEAPPPTAAVLAPRHVLPASRLSPRAWVVLGAFVTLAVGAAAVFPLWEDWRTRQAVEAVVAQQEQARLAGNWTVLRQFYSDDPTVWATNQIVPLSNGLFPAPIDLPGLRPLAQAGRLGQFRVLGPGLVRADVIRSVVLADGTAASFARPHFYKFTGGVWRQVAPPETSPDQARQLHGTRVDMVYYPDDADLAASLAHDLDALVVRACADWGCPADARVPVRFDLSEFRWTDGPLPFDTLLGSLTLQTVFVHQEPYVWREVRLHSRLVGGYPADAPAAEAVRRAAGVQALLGLAQQLTARTHFSGGSSFIDALVVREGVRLGLEPPGLSQIQIADPLYNPRDLWLLGDQDYFREEAQHQALAMLNQILADRGVADERRLLHLLVSGAQDTQAWLAAGLGLTPAEAEARLNAALDPRFPAVQRPNLVPDLALSCPVGPVLASLGGQTAPLLVGEFPDSYVESWSPDGRRLALTVSGRLGVANLADANGQFVPEAIRSWDVPIAWASNTVLVYPPTHATLLFDPGTHLPQISIDPLGLTFFDSFDRERRGIADFDSYLPSPDHTRAAITSNSRGANNGLAVIPALDTSSPPVIDGFDPIWAPDSQQLVFTRLDKGGFVLHRFDLATRTDHTLQMTADPGDRLLPAGTSMDSVFPATWSPTGDWLALMVALAPGGQYAWWVGLIRPDGTGLRILPPASADAGPTTAAFSADGRYLAVDLRGSDPAQDVAIYSVADGSLLRFIPGLAIAGWSPSGHILAVTNTAGVSLLREPGAVPEAFGPVGCNRVAWKPK